MPTVEIGYGPDPATNVAQVMNHRSLFDKATSALAANVSDITQDGAVRTQAQGIVDSPVTNLTTTQIVGVLKQLAQGVAVLAGNDQKSKRELQALIYLLLKRYTTTAGT